MLRRRFLTAVGATAGLVAVAPKASAQSRAVTASRRLLAMPDPGVRLAVVGDIGTGAKPAQAVAAAAARAHAERPFDGLLILGDNVYPNGDPARLQATVFTPYAAILRDAPVFGVLGNHDVREGNGPGQVARLGMPNRWYAKQLGDVLLLCLDSNSVTSDSQYRFIERTLAATTARWRIAAFHHPIYSAGPHGNNAKVGYRWEQLFQDHGVQLVLGGHDHNYQRFAPKNGIVHVVSGSGARLNETTGAGTARFANELQYTDLRIYADRIELRAVNRTDVVLDNHTIAA
jgi:3',5'-cyclic AMP phosphodiesterase CpdA